MFIFAMYESSYVSFCCYPVIYPVVGFKRVDYGSPYSDELIYVDVHGENDANDYGQCIDEAEKRRYLEMMNIKLLFPVKNADKEEDNNVYGIVFDGR